ncbi:MAG: MBL fold metallo-hydrolase, partial [Gemmatimonadota bacterium]|nr:MBL fold metallo-hydrolase [Gemmatimonadota bacterium]
MNGSPRQTAWFGTFSFLLLLGLFARTLPVATEAAQQVEPVRVIPVQGNVYMLQFSNTLGNIGVLPGPDGVLLIDDQVPGMTNNVLRGVREITDEEIRFVINTHVHMDHFGGNPILADMGATIISHKNVRDRMFQPHHTPRSGGTYARAPIAEANRPILTFEDAMNFHMNGEDVRVWLVPRAHTDGDAFTYFATSDVLHTGDVFRTNMYPIIDVFNGGSLAGTIAATETAIALAGPNTKVIPGHGDG